MRHHMTGGANFERKVMTRGDDLGFVVVRFRFLSVSKSDGASRRRHNQSFKTVDLTMRRLIHNVAPGSDRNARLSALDNSRKNIPTAAGKANPIAIATNGDRRRPFGKQRDDFRDRDARDNPGDAAGDAYQHRLGQELHQHMQDAARQPPCAGRFRACVRLRRRAGCS